MKSIQATIGSILVISALMISSVSINAQETIQTLKAFNITIEKSKGEVILKCNEGCAWIDLTFKNNKEFQVINELGMTDFNDDSDESYDELAEFLFAITKTENGISLKSRRGTAWTDLGFSMASGQKRVIDQYGMSGEE